MIEELLSSCQGDFQDSYTKINLAKVSKQSIKICAQFEKSLIAEIFLSFFCKKIVSCCISFTLVFWWSIPLQATEARKSHKAKHFSYFPHLCSLWPFSNVFAFCRDWKSDATTGTRTRDLLYHNRVFLCVSVIQSQEHLRPWKPKWRLESCVSFDVFWTVLSSSQNLNYK